MALLREASFLFVEDEEVAREILVGFLRRRARAVFAAKNGREGLDAYLQHKPDVIVTNIGMPVMNGLEMTEQIKTIDREQRIVFTTGHTEVDHLLKAIELGVDSYVLKPIQKEKLLETLCRVVHEKRLSDLLRANEKKLSDITSSLGEGVLVSDLDGLLTFMNPEAERLLGWKIEELPGRRIYDIIHLHEVGGEPAPYEESPFMGVIRAGIRYSSEEEVFQRRDGTRFPVSCTSTPIFNNGKIVASVTVFRDITKQKKLEEEALRTRKFESIAVLLGGIAHDFNNLLVAIAMNTEMALEDVNPEEPAFETLKDVKEAALTAKDLVRKFISLSMGASLSRKIESINRLLEESAEIVLEDPDIKCEFLFPDDLWTVDIDEMQIRQVMINVITNARESMPTGGTIKISAENVEGGTGDFEAVAPPLPRYVKITIADTGKGIPPEHLPLIFDPYFSTKERGIQKGMGLGLAIVHSIVKRHGGFVQVQSRLGAGTTVMILLPAARTVSRERKDSDQ